MGEAYIVDAVRTPVGRRGGGLTEEHPADLGARVIKGLVERTGIDPLAVDESPFQTEASKLLIDEAPVSLDRALEIISL